MIPFKEMTNTVTGLVERMPWDRSKAQVKLNEIRKRHIDRANADDVERAKAAGLLLANSSIVRNGILQTMVLVSSESTSVDGDERSTRNKHYEVNPIASQIKHSGASVSDAWIPEWRAFCSKPQNDDNVEYPVLEYVPKETSRRSVASSIVATAVADLPTDRRGPGRPRRDAQGM